MAVENKKSTAITNADAVPPTFNGAIAGGQVLTHVGTLATAAADDDGTTMRFARIRSSSRVTSIALLNDAITGATSVDCGLYRTAEDGGAAVDDDCFASAVDINAGNTAWLELRFEADDINDIEDRAWQVAGLTEDPKCWFDVVLTFDTIGSGVGDVTLKVEELID